MLRKNRHIFKILNASTLDCPFCEGNNLSPTAKSLSQTISEVMRTNLEKKYLTSRDYYNSKIINDIIYNENTNIVSVFKDYLIFDDVSEFLKRYYTVSECETRLPRVFEFYEKYSKVFPNYIVLPESKYMFKNIERKQRIIDDVQRYHQNKQKTKKKKTKFSDLLGNSSDTSNDHLFKSDFMDQINESIQREKEEKMKNVLG